MISIPTPPPPPPTPLSAGDPATFSHREFSFTLQDDVYLRYQSFNSQEELEEGVRKHTPYKIDIGAIFTAKVSVVIDCVCVSDYTHTHIHYLSHTHTHTHTHPSLFLSPTCVLV